MGSWSGWACFVWIVFLLVPALVHGEEEPLGRAPVAVRIDVGPAFYRYTESGRGVFDGLETEWEELAVLVRTESRWTSPLEWGGEAGPTVDGILRFQFLTSGEDTETNNQGSSPSELHIAHLFSLQPGIQLPFEWIGGVIVAPELSWDLDWYRQRRDLRVGGSVDEDVFRHGPAAGVALSWAMHRLWMLDVAFRHSFLIHVGVSNTFAESLGFRDLETDGRRDVVELGIARRWNPRWSARVGYRLELTRVDASATRERVSDNAQLVRVQFPENEHRIHAFLLSASLSF